MGTKTNFNRSPYFDDYNEEKDFYKVLFKPGLSVQTRELHQVQDYAQVQVERLADNLFKRGTILAGTNFNFFNPYPYVKLSDFQLDGINLVNPEEYVGAIVEDDVTGLKAYVVNYANGFEASAPDLKTIYVKYINSGISGNQTSFTPGNNITISEGDKTIWRTQVNAGGVGFSNSDQVIFTSALLVNLHSGTFTNSDYLINSDTGANAEIVLADVDSFPGKAVLHIKPRDVDLTNTSVNALSWTFDLYSSITNQDGTVSAEVETIYGSGAIGSVRTDAIGNIREVSMSNRGTQYQFAPQVTVKTTNSSASVGTIDLVAQNYIAKIMIPNSLDSVGNGYAFGVDAGQIYDLGYMLRVAPQVVIVSKYNTQPNNLVAGFLTTEEIVDATKDNSLFDNATGEPNDTAPGADRLKLVPKLVILSKEVAESNADFLTLVEWNSGNPVKQNRNTQYSRIGDQMAQEIYDQSGNFVLDAFQVTTDSPLDQNLESAFYSVIVDPGQAYINGRKRQTLANYRIDIQKGTDTKIAENVISLNYGNYIRLKEVGGSFDTSAGALLKLYDRPKQYISNSVNYANGNTNPVGTQIGTARLRSFDLENGLPGLSETTFRAYVFDVKMNPGQNFENVKSVFADEADYDAIGDCVLEYNAGTETFVAVIKEKNRNQLIFSAGCESLKNSNNSTYQYRSTATTNTVVGTGIISISVAAGSEYFPYGINQELSPSQLREFVVVPVEEDLVCNVAIPGTITVANNSLEVSAVGANFFDHFQAGDTVYVTDTSFDSIRTITAVTGTGALKLDAPPSFSSNAATIRRAFPKNSVIPFGQREGLTANVDSLGQSVTFSFAHSNGASMGFTHGSPYIATKVTFNAERRNVTSSLKTAVRNRYVKLRLSDNAGKVVGPWSLGVPDAFRLRAVYRGNASVGVNSSDVTKDFYIDHNQNANYMGLSYLYLSPQASIALNKNEWLLVCFDYFERDDGGYFDTKSYLRTGDANNIAIQDSLNFADLSQSTAASSWEIPQVFTYDNKYFDLINQFDFRPAVDNTATPNANTALAPINPSETITFSAMSKFPRPNGIMATTQEQYIGRVDDVYIGESGNIYVLKGIPDVNPRRRLQSNHPKDSLRLQTLNIPPYPNATEIVKPTVLRIMDTKVFNEKTSGVRLKERKITPITTTTNLQTSQPMVYTMEDIANLERRIADLEYYAQLTMLEAGVASRNIPSSTDRTVNRFKFGFFADDFSSMIYSDVGNPQYAASFESEGDQQFGMTANHNEQADKSPVGTNIVQPTQIIQKETNYVTPLKYVWSMKHLTENMFFVDEIIIDQNAATETPVITDPCVVQTSNLSALTPGFAYITSINKRVAAAYTENVPGEVTVFFNVYGNSASLGTKIEVKDANGTIVASTAENSTTLSVLSATDKTFLSTNAIAQSFHKSIAVDAYPNFTRNANPSLRNYVVGAGKLTFANRGQKYTISTESLDNVSNVKTFTRYPSVFAVNSLITNKPNCEPANPPVYRGTLAAGSLTLVQWSCSNQFRVNSTNYRSFILKATGLKPNTIHKFYMDSVEWPHVINLTRDMFLASRYDSAWKGASASDLASNVLAHSKKRKVNELTRFLANARAKLYNADGTPTDATIIKSNAQGQAEFMVFMPLDLAGWFSQDFNAEAYAETKIGTGTNPYIIGYNNGKIKPTQGSSGYTALELTNGVDSNAMRVFANRTPSKVIPFDPKGTV